MNTNGQQSGAMVPEKHGSGAALALNTEEFASALEPNNLDQAMILAETFASVGMNGVTSAADALGRIMNGRSMGLSVMQSLQGLFTYEGKQGMYARTMHALCLRSKVCEYFEVVLEESDDKRATCRAKRVGRPEKKHTFTIERAARAQLLDRATPEKTKNSNWVKWTESMLIARCIAELARMEFPDVIFGMRTREELEDDGMAPETDATSPRDPNEMQGEVITNPQPSTVQAVKRDFVKEGDALIAEIDKVFASGTAPEIAAVRAKIAEWDAIEPHRSRVANHYNETKKAKKAAANVAAEQAKS